jgi:tetratricopeptide (TPR) repeat protein
MVCAYEQQKWREAISMADKFNQLAPDTLDYLSIKGRSLLYLNEAKDALPLLKKLTVLNPKKPEVWLWAAQAYQLLGKQKEVEACIGKMLPLANNSHAVIDPAVSFFLSRNNMKVAGKIADYLLLTKDKTFEAMAWSIKAQATNKPQDAIKYLLKAYELKKDNDSLLFIADIYLQEKKYNDAMEYVNKVLKLSPGSPKALFRQAVIFQTLKDYEKAVGVYRKLLEKYPKWSLVLVNLSDIMAAEGKKEYALDLARKAQAESGAWPRAKLCLGLRELDCENYASALTVLEQLIKQEPDNKIAKTAISRCLVPIIREHIDKKYFTLARLRLQQLKKIAPNSKEAADLGELLKSGEKAANTST